MKKCCGIKSITVDCEVVRRIYEYDIDFDGEILATRGDGPLPDVSAPPSGPYVLTFPSALVNPSIDVTVSGEVGTGDSTGINANAFIPQGVTFINDTQAEFSLLSGDDGGGVDDGSRRKITVRVFADKKTICAVYADGNLVQENSTETSDLALSDTYVVRRWQDNGFFNTDNMNGQIQIFNTESTPGPSSWELRFDSNYDITSLNASGATAGAIQKTDNGSDYSYVIPFTGAIPGNNGNVQISIQGVRHPLSSDASAQHYNEGVYV